MMSAQLLELIFFAGIAFFVISKLISTLGHISDDDDSKKRGSNGSFFGEPSAIKDVTPNAKEDNSSNVIRIKAVEAEKVAGLILEENQENILNGLRDIELRLPTFSLSNFQRSAVKAFKLIIDAVAANNKETLSTLVDKRYLEQFSLIAPNYGNFTAASDALDAKISEIYMFGNNAFIKVLFYGQNVTSIKEGLKEEWTFSRNMISSSADWHLTNVDRAA